MKIFSDIKTFGDLMERIAQDFPDKSIREVAKIIGMGDKSYYVLKGGKPPHSKLLRTIKAFVEKQYGLDIEILHGNKIKLKNIDHGSTSIVAGGNVNQNDGRLKYLLDKNIELEKDNQKLKEELATYQAQPRKRKQ